MWTIVIRTHFRTDGNLDMDISQNELIDLEKHVWTN